MKFIIILSLLLLFLQASFASEEVDIVFDLDWTIVSTIDTSKPFQHADERCIKIDEFTYRKADYLEEMISELLKNPKVRISFYSGGEKERNYKLLEEIKLDDGRTLKEIAHKILSKEDLAIYNPREDIKFWEKYKKDLSRINENVENVILIDDVKDFTPAVQSKNVLWIQNKEYHFSSWESARDALRLFPNDEFIPKTKEQWLKNKYRLLWAQDVLLSSLKEYESQSGLSFSDIIFSKTHFKNKVIPLTSPSEIKKIESFLQELQSNPTSKTSCVDLLLPFAL